MASKDKMVMKDLQEMDLPLDLKGEQVLDFPSGGNLDDWEFDPVSQKIRFRGVVVSTSIDDEGNRLSQLRYKTKYTINMPFDFFWDVPWTPPVRKFYSGTRRPLQPTRGGRSGPRRITTLKKSAIPRRLARSSVTRDFSEPVDPVPVIQVPFAPIAEGGARDFVDSDVHDGTADDIPKSPIIPEFAHTSPPPLHMFSPHPVPTLPVWKAVSESRRAGSFSGAHELIYISSDEEFDDEDDPEVSPSYYH